MGASGDRTATGTSGGLAAGGTAATTAAHSSGGGTNDVVSNHAPEPSSAPVSRAAAGGNDLPALPPGRDDEQYADTGPDLDPDDMSREEFADAYATADPQQQGELLYQALGEGSAGGSYGREILKGGAAASVGLGVTALTGSLGAGKIAQEVSKGVIGKVAERAAGQSKLGDLADRAEGVTRSKVSDVGTTLGNTAPGRYYRGMRDHVEEHGLRTGSSSDTDDTKW